MTWLAVLLICQSLEDCAFAYKETTSPMACEKAVIEMIKAAEQHQVPFARAVCLPVKGVTS